MSARFGLLAPLSVLLILALTGCPVATVLPAPSALPTVAGSAAPAALPSPPPWPTPPDAFEKIKAAGFEATEKEQLIYHIHSHLDVFFNREPVTVPANIGIGTGSLFFISPLHTHDTTGTLHIEAPERVSVTLGQFFVEWGVPLTGAIAYDNGVAVIDPVAHLLKDLHQVTVVFGTPPQNIPAVYPK